MNKETSTNVLSFLIMLVLVALGFVCYTLYHKPDLAPVAKSTPQSVTTPPVVQKQCYGTTVKALKKYSADEVETLKAAFLAIGRAQCVVTQNCEKCDALSIEGAGIFN